MSYQSRKYRQAGMCVERNNTAPVVNTSSDLCVFTPPIVEMSATTVIDCQTISCDFSGVTGTTLLTSGLTTCISGEIGISCLENIDWSIRIDENDMSAYNIIFDTIASTTNSPTESEIISGILDTYNIAGYEYEVSGTSIMVIDKPLDVTAITTNLCATFNIDCGEIDNNTNIYVMYDSSGSYAPNILGISTAIRAWFTGFTASTPTYTGNMYEMITSDENWLSRATYPWLGVASGYSFDTSPAYTSVIAVPPGASTGDTTGAWSGEDKNVIIICMTDEAATVYHDSLTPSGLSTDYGTEPTATYTTDWNNFQTVYPNYDSFRGYVYANRTANGGAIAKFYLQIYAAVQGDKVPVADFIDSPYVTSISGSLSAITFSNPYSALTDVNGSGLKNYGWYEKHDFTGITTPFSFDEIGDDFNEFISASTGVKSACTVCEELCYGEYIIPISYGNHIIENNQTGLTMSFEFLSGYEAFTGSTDAEFFFTVHKYDSVTGLFNRNVIYTSPLYDWADISGNTYINLNIPINTLDLDGEYIIKSQYVYNVCTEFANLLGKKLNTSDVIGGSEYGIYNSDRDGYFVAMTAAQTPILNISGEGTVGPYGFVVMTMILEENQNTVSIQSSSLDYIVSLNGLTLAQDEDYTLAGVTGLSITTTITLLGPIILGDVLTIAFINSGGGSNTTLRSDVFDITGPIPSGPLDGQGSNDVYFNTTSNKYEIYLDMTPVNGDDIYVTLNGITLANNIDYYQSTSDPKRIILEGILIVTDLLTAYYTTFTDAQGVINNLNMSVAWLINNPPNSLNGLFTVETSTGDTFTVISSSATTNYIIGVNSYSQSVALIEPFGTNMYYRVKNEKFYDTICNDTLSSIAYSEIVPITVGTNLANNY